MTLQRISSLVLRPPDLWATRPNGGNAIGHPIQIAPPLVPNETPDFPGWEDVGYEYLDQEYDA